MSKRKKRLRCDYREAHGRPELPFGVHQYKWWGRQGGGGLLVTDLTSNTGLQLGLLHSLSKRVMLQAVPPRGAFPQVQPPLLRVW